MWAGSVTAAADCAPELCHGAMRRSQSGRPKQMRPPKPSLSSESSRPPQCSSRPACRPACMKLSAQQRWANLTGLIPEQQVHAWHHYIGLACSEMCVVSGSPSDGDKKSQIYLPFWYLESPWYLCRRRRLHVTALQSGSRAVRTAWHRSELSWPTARRRLPRDQLQQLWSRQHCSRLCLLQRQTTSLQYRQAMRQCQIRVNTKLWD